MNDQFDTSTKVVIDLFNRQYSQFDDAVKRLINSNDKAHDQLFEKIESLSDGQTAIQKEIHEISTSQKIMVNNQEAHEKRIEGINEKVQELSERVDEIEQSYLKDKHVLAVGWKWVGGIAVLITIALGILRLLNII